MTMISKLELKLLKKLYKKYKKTHRRELWRCTDAFKVLGLNDGNDLSPISNSSYIDTVLDGTHEAYQINAEGIRYMDNRKPFLDFTKENKIIVATASILVIGLLLFLFNWSLGGISIFGINLTPPPQISITDVQYELQDENKEIISRRSWQLGQVTEADSRNISRMLVSIKLGNPNDSQIFAKVENYDEIFDNPYVVDSTGDFLDEMYSVPAGGNSGFISAIDLTPFTKVVPTSPTTDSQYIEFYDEHGNYLESGQVNIAKTYGISIPYKIGVYNKNRARIDTLEFKVRCRAQMSNLRAILESESGRAGLSKSLNFECLPTS